MTKSIQCTNSNCQTTIPVPDGGTYVSCPNCGTFYFPSDLEIASNNPSPPTPAHDLPPLWAPEPEPPAAASAPNPGPWLPENPEFMRPKPPVHAPENVSVGCLVMYDGTQLPLKVGSNLIGRKEGNILINDKTVSRKHCAIEVSPKETGGGWNFFISDIGQQTGQASTNGVFIENRSIRLENYERIQIYHGMTIQLGSVYLRLHAPHF